MSNIVGILLLKLFARDFGKVFLKELQGIVHGESSALEKESILKATPMTQMLVSLQTSLQLLHTEWHVRLHGRHIGGIDGGCGILKVLARLRQGMRHVLDKGSDAQVFRRGRHMRKQHELFGEIGSKARHENRVEFRVWHVDASALQNGLSLGYEIECLSKGHGKERHGGDFCGIIELFQKRQQRFLFLLGNGREFRIGLHGSRELFLRERQQSVMKERALLLDEPAAQFLRLAVREPQNKVRHVVDVGRVELLLLDHELDLGPRLVGRHAVQAQLLDLAEDLRKLEKGVKERGTDENDVYISFTLFHSFIHSFALCLP